MGESFHGLRAVARVLIQRADGQILLCRGRTGTFWVLPGGTLDPGESLPQAAAREAEEEAGLRVTVGPLLFVQEFRPAHRPEHVLEACFLATPRAEQPEPREGLRPAGPESDPWQAWLIQDLDGPVREVRWVSREQLAALAEPVYPAYVKQAFWERPGGIPDPYLGLVSGK